MCMSVWHAIQQTATPCWPVFQLPHWHCSSKSARSGTHHYGSQAAWSRDSSSSRVALVDSHWEDLVQAVLAGSHMLGHTPEYISDLLTSVANIPGRSTLRASSCGNLIVPRTRRRIGDRAFSVAAPQAWNRLPTELKLLQLMDLFRRDLKTFLFNSVYAVTGTRIQIDSVMRPRSSSRERNTSASVTVTVTVVSYVAKTQLTALIGIVGRNLLYSKIFQIQQDTSFHLATPLGTHHWIQRHLYEHMIKVRKLQVIQRHLYEHIIQVRKLQAASPVWAHHQGEKITSNQTWTQKFCCLVGPCGTHQSCYQKLTFHSPATLLATQSDTSCEQYHNDLSKPIVVPGPCVLQRMLSSRF